MMEEGAFAVHSPNANDFAKAQEYARRRARETKRTYLVSTYARVLVDCAQNRQALRDLGEGVHMRFSPVWWD